MKALVLYEHGELDAVGYVPLLVDISEFEKAEAGVSCLSVILSSADPRSRGRSG